MTAVTMPPKTMRRDELEALGERIAELSAQIQAATYLLLEMIRDFDERGGWNSGFRSCAHWLNWRTGLELGAAREKVRVARALAALPLISQAMRHGEVSYSKVRALTRVAAPANEAELLIFAKAGTAAHVEKLVRAWRRVDRLAEAEREKRRHASRYLSYRIDEDGMVVLQARLAPEAGAALLRALDAAAAKLYDAAKEQRAEAETGDGVSGEQRRADALGLVAESALASGLDPGSRGDRYQVVVHIDESALAADGGDGLAGFEDGAHVSAETSRRLTCDTGTGDHAPRRQRQRPRRRPPDSHDLTSPAPRSCSPRPRLPLPRLRPQAMRRPPCAALGGWRHDEAREPGVALPAAPSGRARGGIPSRSRSTRRAALPSS